MKEGIVRRGVRLAEERHSSEILQGGEGESHV